MGLFGKKKDAYTQSPTSKSSAPASPAIADPRTDPNLIRVFDEFGRECFITKEQWRTSVLPGTLKKNWDNPEQLYGIIVGTLNDGFFADVLAAAEHLWRIDPNHVRGTCAYGTVLIKNSHINEAEHVLRSYVEKHGEDGYVLTNLAKVYAARKETQKVEDTLWRALEVDPNQNNGLVWYTAIHRERNGNEAGLEATRRVAALQGSWRAQLWLAREALESHNLGNALAYYRESMSRIGDTLPADFLMQMSGDLGKHGHLAELLNLAEPRFIPEIHGLLIGNNLIKAHLDLGQIEAARKILEQLYSLKRPDWKHQLSFWDTEIAKALVAANTTNKGAEPLAAVILGVVEGPIWLKPSSHAAGLFPIKTPNALVVCFLGSTAELATKSDRVQFQVADAPGRMSRAVPLFLAERIGFCTPLSVKTLIPWVEEKGGAFVLSAVAWSDQEAVNHSRREEVRGDYVVVSHLKAQAEPWTVDLRLIRVADGNCIGTLAASFQSAKPEEGIPELARRLVALLAEKAGVKDQQLPRFYQVPNGANFPTYLLRLEQLLAVRSAAINGVQSSFLSGQHEIVDGNIQLCATCPDNVGVRLLLAQTLLAMKKVSPSLLQEFKNKVLLLQQKKHLPEPAHGIVQRLFDEALRG